MLDLLFHLSKHLSDYLNAFATAHPVGVYALLMTIIFCETGIVVWPFLPGDSLLIIAGSMAAQGAGIHLPLVIPLLCLAANLGDICNYLVGRRLGPAVFHRQDSWLLNKKHLMEAHKFYERHGRKTIILARFVPIVRTFAPLVAGIGEMEFKRFIGFSVAGGVFWVTTVTLAGFWFGGIPMVQKHFELVVVGIVSVSVIPVIVGVLRAKERPEGAKQTQPN